MKIVWRKHNLISSSVGSGHLGKYLYEIPHEYLKGWGNLSGKIISVKRNHWSNLVSFFLNSDFSPRICCHFFRTTLFWVKLLLPIFSELLPRHKLLFRDSYFFRAAAFFSFFRKVTFSQGLFFHNSFFFWAKLLQSRHFLRIRSSLRQLLLGTAILSGGTA